MTGVFSSLNTALTALRYQRVAMDVASSNIANVTTDGYARRRVEGAAVGGPTQPALWSRYDGAGDGVQVTGVDRMTDELLNVRARREHGNQAYLDVRQASLDRVENGLGEPGDSGVSAALADFRTPGTTSPTTPSSESARGQVLAARAASWTRSASRPATSSREAGDQRVHLLDDVSEVNTVAAELADTNKAIAAGHPRRLRRRRSCSTSATSSRQRLAELTGAKATVRSDGGADVTVNGVPLVTGSRPAASRIASGVTPDGDSDGNPITFAVMDASGATAVPVRHERRGRRAHRPAHHHAAGVPGRPQRRRQGPGRHGQHPARRPGSTQPVRRARRSSPTTPPTCSAPCPSRSPTPPWWRPRRCRRGTRRRQRQRARHGPGVDGGYQRLVTGLGTEVASSRAAGREPAGTDQPGRRRPRAAQRASTSTRRW